MPFSQFNTVPRYRAEFALATGQPAVTEAVAAASLLLVMPLAVALANIAKVDHGSFAFPTPLVLPDAKVGVAKPEAAPLKKGAACLAMNTFGMVATKTTMPKRIEIFL